MNSLINFFWMSVKFKCQRISKLNTLPKIKFFFWICYHDRIPSPPNNTQHNVVWLLNLKNLNHTFTNQSLRWEIFLPFAILHIWLNYNNNIFHNTKNSISTSWL